MVYPTIYGISFAMAWGCLDGREHRSVPFWNGIGDFIGHWL